MLRRPVPALLVAACCLVLAHGSRARSEPARDGRVAVELISEVLTLRPGQPTWLALRFQMDPGWHINWRNAGDAGLAPVIQWQLPPGFQTGEIQWPLPERLVVKPLASYGYEGTVLLPVEIKPAALAAGEVTLRAHVDWLACQDVCLPGNADVELSIPVVDSAPQLDRRWDVEFADARFHLPLGSSDWTVDAGLSDSSIAISVEPPAWWQGDLGEIFFLPYASDVIQHAAAQTVTRDGDRYTVRVPRATNNPVAPKRIRGILVSSSGWRGEGSEQALEVDVAFGATTAGAATSSASTAAPWGPLLFAFLGGLILNLMPCVLPVLSIKVLSLVQSAGQSNKTALAHGLLYTAGVLASFWVLAGLLLALRGAGEALGWGFQLQSPVFVVAMAGVFFLLGLSLFGVFEIGTSIAGLGAGASGRSGALGAFSSGILAVIVATPCTAPFMGSALGYALTQPALLSLLVFTALGIGLALPYVLLASSPRLLRYVPKPGAWMETLKQFLGFLLMATVVWMAWVLGNQAGPQAVAVMLSMLLLLALAAWIWGRWGAPSRGERSRRWAFVTGALLLVFAAGWGMQGVTLFGATQAGADPGDTTWSPYDEAELARRVAEGTPVLVDFTADWCLSCKVNEQVALSSSVVQKRMQELGVVLMKADWTLRSEAITHALAKFGRTSVPLYVLYTGGGADQFVTLPEILTPGIVIDALNQLDSHNNKGDTK